MYYPPHDAAVFAMAQSALRACHTAAPEASYPMSQLPNSLPGTGK